MISEKFEEITGISVIKMKQLDKYYESFDFNQKKEIFDVMAHLYFKKKKENNIALVSFYLIINDKFNNNDKNRNNVKVIVQYMKLIWVKIEHDSTLKTISNIIFKYTNIRVSELLIEETMDILNVLD
jgi:hypothetical protein